MNITKKILLAVLMTFTGLQANAADGGRYSRVVTDNGIVFKYKVRETFLDVEVSCDTTGWVSVGFDPIKRMLGADFVIGYVDVDGKVAMRDDFGDTEVSHKSDLVLGGMDNIANAKGTEKNGITTLAFSIPLKSGDKNDVPLTLDQNHVAIFGCGGDGFDNFVSKHKKIAVMEFKLSSTSEEEDPKGIAIEAIAPMRLTLGQRVEIPLVLKAGAEFVESDVGLILDRSSLEGILYSNAIGMALNSKSLRMKAGQVEKVVLTIDAPSFSPSFEAKMLRFSAKVGDKMFGQDFPLSIQAVFEVAIMGGASPEKWSLPELSTFRPHAGGVKVRFTNWDAKDKHIVHSSGAIPHGPTDKPLAPSVDGKAGGVYEVQVPVAEKPTTAGVYCHLHEDGKGPRKFVFNQRD